VVPATDRSGGVQSHMLRGVAWRNRMKLADTSQHPAKTDSDQMAEGLFSSFEVDNIRILSRA
jgi:hypothetical protein